MKAKVTSLIKDLDSQSKVNGSINMQLNKGIKCRVATLERIAFLENTFQQGNNIEASSPEVAASEGFKGESK